MAEVIFEPYAAHLHWRLSPNRDDYRWQRILAEFLETLANCCEVEGQSVIGHIKGLATYVLFGRQLVRAAIASSVTTQTIPVQPVGHGLVLGM